MIHFNRVNVNRLLTTTMSQAGYLATTNQPKKEANNNKENEQCNNGSIIRYHYCWTHGVNKTHKGSQCTYPKAF
jgi:hypothetical protein